MVGQVGATEKATPVLVSRLVSRCVGMQKDARRGELGEVPKENLKLAALPRYPLYKIQPDLTNPQFFATFS